MSDLEHPRSDNRVTADVHDAVSSNDARRDLAERVRKDQAVGLFLDKLKLQNAVTPTSFRAFRNFLDQPLKDLPPAGDPKITEAQRVYLQKERGELEEVRLGLATSIDDELANIVNGEATDDEEAWSDFRTTLAVFAARVDLYTENVTGLKAKEVPWKALIGVAANEAVEEGFEVLGFRKESVFTSLAEKIGNEKMRGLLAADVKIAETLRLRGITKVPLLKDVLGNINKTPFGGEMFEKLLTIESPFTVLFYAYYLHSTDNKIKGTMNYAMFLSSSGVINASLETAAAMLQSERVLAIAGPRVGAWLSKIAKIPGHPVIKFAAALGIMIAGQKYIDELTTKLDSKIAHSGTRHGVELGISMLSGDALLDYGNFALREFGITDINPETDSMSYLLAEVPTIEKGGLDRHLLHDEQAWNAIVDQKIQSSQFVHPLRKKLWELEKIDATWYPRQAMAVHDDIVYLRGLEEKLAEKLAKLPMHESKDEQKNSTSFTPTLTSSVAPIHGGSFPVIPRTEPDTKPILRDARLLDLSSTITSDDSDLRVDRLILMLRDDATTPIGRVHAAMMRRPDGDPLKKEWEEYLAFSTRVAQRVVMVRHLKHAHYQEKKWVGTEGDEPDLVGKGRIEELIYTLRRKELLEKLNTIPETTDHKLTIRDKADAETLNTAALALSAHAVIPNDDTIVKNPRYDTNSIAEALSRRAFHEKIDDNFFREGTMKSSGKDPFAFIDPQHRSRLMFQHLSDGVASPASIMSQRIQTVLGSRIGTSLKASPLPSNEKGLVQYIETKHGATVIMLHRIRGTNKPYEEWFIETSGGVYEGEERRHSMMSLPPKTMSFTEWRSTFCPDGLPHDFMKSIIDLQTSMKLDQEKALRAETSAKTSSTFVQLTGPEYGTYYQRSLEGKTVRYIPDDAPQMSATRQIPYGMHRFAPDRIFSVEVIDEHAKISKRLKIRNIHELKGMQESSLLKDLLVTPNQQEDAEPIDRILNLCPADAYIPSPLASLFYTRRSYQQELHDALIPRYLAAKDQRLFLKNLVDALIAEEVIGVGTKERVLKRVGG